MLDMRVGRQYNSSMKKTNTDLSVKSALALGMAVRLPNVLDDYMLMDMDSDTAIQHISYELADEHDISATQAEDVIRGTLADLGVEL